MRDGLRLGNMRTHITRTRRLAPHGFREHPWVMVRHADDHVHVVVCRVSDEGTVWHGRNDRRAAQSACTRLKLEHDLQTAPRRREAGRGKRSVLAVR